jgi:hypothetical protein
VDVVVISDGIKDASLARRESQMKVRLDEVGGHTAAYIFVLFMQ